MGRERPRLTLEVTKLRCWPGRAGSNRFKGLPRLQVQVMMFSYLLSAVDSDCQGKPVGVHQPEHDSDRGGSVTSSTPASATRRDWQLEVQLLEPPRVTPAGPGVPGFTGKLPA